MIIDPDISYDGLLVHDAVIAKHLAYADSLAASPEKTPAPHVLCHVAVNGFPRFYMTLIHDGDVWKDVFGEDASFEVTEWRYASQEFVDALKTIELIGELRKNDKCVSLMKISAFTGKS